MAASALAVVQLAGGPNVARERLLAHFGVSAASEAEDAVPVLRGVAVAVVGDAGVEGGGEESQAVERGGLVSLCFIYLRGSLGGGGWELYTGKTVSISCMMKYVVGDVACAVDVAATQSPRRVSQIASLGSWRRR